MPAAPPRDAGEDLRDRILHATLEIGAELGAEGLTMRGIAARLGISTTAMYQHFDSKAEILQEVRRHGLRVLARTLRAARQGAGDCPAQVRAMARAFIRFSRDHRWLYAILMEQDTLEWKELLEVDARAFMEPLGEVRDCLREGVDKGQLRADLDPTLGSYELWAVVHGAASLLRTGRISEKHPSLPIPSADTFVIDYVDHAVAGIIG